MSDFDALDPLLHSQLRLAVMSVLIAAESADFVYLKEKTGASAGNLSVQLDKLAEAGYINIKKGYQGKRPQTTCQISKAGIKAFERYVNTIQQYITPIKDKQSTKS